MADTIYICFDYGDKRTGIALSDARALMASGYTTFVAGGPKAASRQALEYLAEILPTAIVVGYPVAPDGGSRGERCAIVDQFIAELGKRTNLPIHRQDERGSSIEARDIIHAHGKSVTKKRREAGTVDQIAAAIILQRWLDARNAQLDEN